MAIGDCNRCLHYHKNHHSYHRLGHYSHHAPVKRKLLTNVAITAYTAIKPVGKKCCDPAALFRK